MHTVRLEGFSMVLHGDNYLEQEIIKSGAWEPSTTRFFRDALRVGQVVVDIGANVGYFSLLSAALVGPAGQVHSFEPYPGYVERMKLSLTANNFANIRLNEFALGDRRQRHKLFKGLASARMHRWKHENPVFNKVHDEVEVECIRFDDYAAQNLTRVDLMKIDVDGYEISVLRGAAETIKKYRPVVVIEVYEDALRDAGGSSAELSAMFHGWGYQPYSEKGELFSYEELAGRATAKPATSTNVVFRPAVTDGAVSETRKGAGNQLSSVIETNIITTGFAASKNRSQTSLSSAQAKILFLAVNYEGWVAPAVFFEQRAIARKMPQSVFYGPGYNYNTNYVPDIIKETFGPNGPDAIFCYVNGDRLLGKSLDKNVICHYGLKDGLQVFPRGLRDTSVPKVAWINDFWQYSAQQWEEILLGNGFETAFATYCPPFVCREVFDAFFSRQVQDAVRFVPWPRAINPEIFRDYGLTKNNDVTMLGAMNESFYPLRTRMHREFSKQPDIRYFHQAHPGYKYFCDGQVLTGEAYAKVINSSKIFASCTGKYRIPFIKLYEVLGCNTALMCDKPFGAEFLGLKEKENYIDVTADNFLDTTRRYLSEGNELLRIAKNGGEIFLGRHTVDVRAREFAETISNVLNGKESQGWAQLYNKTSKPTFRTGTQPNTAQPDRKGEQKNAAHITEVSRSADEQTLSMWCKYGLNNRPNENPPVVTEFPELVVLRGVYLRQLAEQIGAKYMAEVGTARGFQSFIWAQYLIDNAIDDGLVYTCDIAGMDAPIYKTPLTGDKVLTRKQLWANTPQQRFIRFVHGDSARLAESITHKLDILYIDGQHTEDAVSKDFENLSRLLHPGSTVIFDDCDERFEGVQNAARQIAKQQGVEFQIIEFTPHRYKIAVMKVPDDSKAIEAAGESHSSSAKGGGVSATKSAGPALTLTSRDYWDRSRKKEFKPWEVKETQFSRILEKYLPVNDKFSCVEIGAYPGANLCDMAKRFKYYPVAIEFSDYRDHIEKLLRFNGIEKFKVLKQDFLEPIDMKFDVVTSFGFIEHFQNYEEIIDRHVDLLKPGGYLVISCPYLDNFQGKLRELVYTEEKLSQVLSSHNLKVMNLDEIKRVLGKYDIEICLADFVMGNKIWLDPNADYVKPEMKWLVKYLLTINAAGGERIASSKLYSPMIMVIARDKSNVRGKPSEPVSIQQDLEQRQWLGRREIEESQWGDLKSLLVHSYNNVPFYRRRFDEVGMRPDDIRSIDDFRKIPVLKKADIQRNLESIKAGNCPQDQLIRDATGGSTGQPLVFYRDLNAKAWIDAAALRFRRWMGYGPSSKLALIWGADRDVPESYPANQRWLNSFNCSEQDIEKFVEELVQWQPDAIRAYASSLYMVASYIRNRGLRAPRPGAIESAAEKLWDWQRKVVEEVFGCKVFEMYGSREIPALACECERHNGMHIFSDLRLVEVIKDGRCAEPGEEGTIVITDLLNYGMPFIRYEIGDIGVLSEESCPCGRGFPLLKEIKGRITSTIRTPDGRRIHGEYFTHLFYGVAGVKAFQVHQTKLDEVIVSVQPETGFDRNLIERVIAKMCSHLGDGVFVKWECADQIPAAASGKRHFTISDVPVDFGGVGEASKVNAAEVVSTDGQLKKVLFIVDRPNWAHDFKTDNLMRRLGDRFSMTKRYKDNVTAEDIQGADLIVVYYWKEFNDPNMVSLLEVFLENRHKLLIGICSHQEMSQDRDEVLGFIRNLACGVFVNSRLLYEEFSPCFDVPVFYTPNGVDTEFFTPAHNRSTNQKLKVGWAGSMTNHGDTRGYHDLIVPATGSVEGVELVVAVREDKWRSPGEMLEFYRSVDVYICASTAEGTPNPCLEAAACGVPLLTTRVGNMPELIEDGKNGFFIERDVNDIKNKLILLRDNPALRLKMSVEILKSIQEWDWSKQAENYKKIFDTVMFAEVHAEPNESMQTSPSQAVGGGQANYEAVKYFLKAQGEFNKERFVDAFELMHKYRTAVDYRSLARFVRGEKNKDVDVSVVIVTYNRTEDVRKCIESVEKQQTPREKYEIIVVDNGLTDEEVVKPLCDQYVKCPANLYLSEGRNIGACFAGGRIIAFLDDDASVGPDYIGSIKEAFNKYNIFGFRGKVLPKTDAERNRQAVNYDRGDKPFCTFCDQEGNSAFLKDVYLDVNGMDPLLFGHEGTDLSYRIIRKYALSNKIIYWPRTVIYHDVTEGDGNLEKQQRYELISQYLQLKHNTNLHILRQSVETEKPPAKFSDERELSVAVQKKPFARSDYICEVEPDVRVRPKAGKPADDVPVAVITYNRPKHTYEVLQALKAHNIKNIYIFSDAPRNQDDVEKVSVIRKLSRAIDWTEPKIIERQENIGLARNIVDAIDHVFTENDRLVLLEDDCVPQKYFFDFINSCLEKYQDNDKIFGISGYTAQIPEHILQQWPFDLYFFPRICSWGWATWKRAWQHREKDLRAARDKARQMNIDICQGGNDVLKMIEAFLAGSLKDVWTLNWAVTVYLNNGYYIYPRESHVNNIGMDGSGIHIGRTNKFDTRIADSKPGRFPDEIIVNGKICDYLRTFHDVPNCPRSSVSVSAKDANSPLVSESNRKKKVLIVRSDSIGDLVIFGGSFQYYRQLYPNCHITLVVTEGAGNLAEVNPYIDEVITFSRSKITSDQEYSDQFIRQIQAGRYDVAICPAHSRDRVSDFIVINSGAQERITTSGDTANQTAEQVERNNKYFTKILPASGGIKLETFRNEEFLRNLGAKMEGEYAPMAWFTKDDVDFAEGLLERTNVQNPILLAPFAQSPIRDWRVQDWVRLVSSHKDIPVVICGLEANRGNADKIIALADHPNVHNLCGETSVRQLAALVSKSRLCVSPESAAAHLAAAAGCPHVVLVGGGHFGRFMPYSKLTRMVYEKMDCFGCNWRCKYGKDIRCIKAVSFEMVEEAARSSLGTGAEPGVTQLSERRSDDKAYEYLVSAIVSTYNSEKFIRGCIEDLENQTIADKLEIIVVNSGSQQNEEAIVKEFQQKYSNIKYMKTQHRETIYQAWNRAVKAASGKYLAVANTDDRRRADALEIMAGVLESDPGIALVYADQYETAIENEAFENVTASGENIYPDFEPDVFIETGFCRIGSQPVWRADIHKDIGDFDGNFEIAGDYDFLLRVCEKYRCFHIPQILGTFYRSRGKTISCSSEFRLNQIENPLALSRSLVRKGIKCIEKEAYNLAIEYLRKSLQSWPSREAAECIRKAKERTGQRISTNSGLGLEHLPSIWDWPKELAAKRDVAQSVIKFEDDKTCRYILSVIVCGADSVDEIRSCLDKLTSQSLAGKVEIQLVARQKLANTGSAIKGYQNKFANLACVEISQDESIWGGVNRAIRSADGRFLTIIKPGYEYDRSGFEEMVKRLEGNADEAGLYVTVASGGSPGEKYTAVGMKNEAHITLENLFDENLTAGRLMWRRSLHKILGYFDEMFFAAAEYEFWFRVAQDYGLACMDGVLSGCPECKYDFDLSFETGLIEKAYRYGKLCSIQIGERGISGNEAFAGWFEINVLKKRTWEKVHGEGCRLISNIKDNRKNAASPLLSIVIVTRDRIKALMENLKALAGQTESNFEIIIVSNGSSSSLGDIPLGDLSVCWIYLDSNYGPSLARNVGTNYARADLIAFLDDDAVAQEHFVQNVRRHFERRDIYGLRGKVLAVESEIAPEIYDLGNEVIPFAAELEGNCAFRKDMLQRVGGFDECLFHFEGFDLSYRIFAATGENIDSMLYVPDVVVYHEPHRNDGNCIEKTIRSGQMERYVREKYPHINAYLDFMYNFYPSNFSKIDTKLGRLINNASFLRERKPTEALKWAQKAVELKPDGIGSRLLLGSIYLKLAEHEKAQCELEWVVESIDKLLMSGACIPVHDPDTQETDIREFYLQAAILLAQSYSATRNFASVKWLYEKVLQNAKVEMPQEHRTHMQSVLQRLQRLPVQNIPVPAERAGQQVPQQSDEILVSAIVSTYNCEEFIRGCLEDLENQTIADKLEIIVVNSGSQQNEEAIVKEFQAKYNNIVYIKTEERESVYKAWNRGVKAARGKFLTNANTDDRHRPDALEVLSNELINNPELAVVYGDQICTDTPNGTFERHNTLESYQQPDYDRERLLLGCCVGSQPMWRRSLHEELGYFDETLECAGDWDFWLRVSEKYCFKHIPEFLGLYYFNQEGVEHGNKFHSFYERYAVGKKYGTSYISTFNTYHTERDWLVSVIMPAYNAQKYIRQAIESVLIQNYRHFELVIVNDGSTDGTEEIVHSYEDEHIRYFKQANRGLAATHNEGIRQARGEFLIKVDTDDFIAVDFIGRHLNEFYNHRDVDLVYCDDCLVEEDGKPIRVITRPEYADRRMLIRDLFRSGFPVVPFRTCIQRRVFEKIGLFDESLRIGEDYDMMRRFVKAGLKAHHLKAALYYRRLACDSLSRQYSVNKARQHFAIVRSYAEAFLPDELFPEVQWERIPAGIRDLHFKCLVAMNFISLGQSYIETNLPSYAGAALQSAGEQLKDCLKIAPDNQGVKKLMDRCRRLEESLSQTVLVNA